MLSKIHSGNGYLSGPAVDGTGQVFFVSMDHAEVFMLNRDGSLQSMPSTGGMPSAVAFDLDNNMYAGDFALAGVFSLSTASSSAGRPTAMEWTEYVKEYESKALKGPSSLCFDSANNMYFTDSGPSGTTGLFNPSGSLFCITSDNQILQPLLLECLADPVAVCIVNHSTPEAGARAIYVAEQGKNRILRLVKTSHGTFEASVFVQLAGRYGPRGVAVDENGNLYVCRFDYASASMTRDGEVVVFSPAGVELRRIVVPGAVELTGIVYNLTDRCMYVTEGTTQAVYRIQISGND